MGKLIRLGEFALHDVLPAIGPDSRLTVQGQDGKSYSVGTESVRLQCFKKNLSCVKCGLTGSKFFLEMHAGNIIENPHFNLYAFNDEGEEVLMTKDHCIPVSKGGSNELHNMQTMCAPCNSAKGSKACVYLVVPDANPAKILGGFIKRAKAEKFIEQLTRYNLVMASKMLYLNITPSEGSAFPEDDERYMAEYHRYTLELVPEQFREHLSIYNPVMIIKEVPLK